MKKKKLSKARLDARNNFDLSLATNEYVEALEREVAEMESNIEVKEIHGYLLAYISQIDFTKQALPTTPLNKLFIGWGDSLRVGNVVAWRQLKLRYSITLPYDEFTFTPRRTVMRILVVWHPHWDIAPSSNYIGHYLENYGIPTVDVIAHVKWSNRKDFIFLHDQIYYAVDTGSPTSNIGGDYVVDLEGLKTQYNGDAIPSNANIEQGCMYMYVLSDADSTHTQKPQIRCTYQLTYTDA